jgi:hypothetical protein
MTLANLEENRITLGRPRAPCSWPRTFCGSSARACIRIGRRAQQLAIATRPHPRRSTPCRSERCESKPIGLGWARWPPTLCRPLASQSEDCMRRLPPVGRKLAGILHRMWIDGTAKNGQRAPARKQETTYLPGRGDDEVAQALRCRQGQGALHALSHQRHPAPSCGGHALPRREFTESLTPDPELEHSEGQRPF